MPHIGTILKGHADMRHLYGNSLKKNDTPHCVGGESSLYFGWEKKYGGGGGEIALVSLLDVKDNL